MPVLAASPFLKALGWALVNSLWQFAICWLVYRFIVAGMKTLTAAAKHSLALLLLFGGAISFIGSLSWTYYASAGGGRNSRLLDISAPAYYNIWHAADNAIDGLMPYWSVAYLLCVLFLLVKFCLFVQRAGNLQKNGISKMDVQWRMYVKDICWQLGIHQDVNAMLSAYIDTPQVIGFFKPVILLPAACLVNLSTEQLEAVLLHELVHIKRNDYLLNLFVTSIEILFFFNPFVKQLTASIRKEREYSCDDMVIQFKYHPHNYASALLLLEKNRLMPVTYGIAASGKNEQQLLTRIERIMGTQSKQVNGYKLGSCLMALLLLGLIATTNPAKMAVDKFGTDGLLLANHIIGLPYSDEPAKQVISNQQPALAEVKKDADKQVATVTITAATPAATADDDRSIQTVHAGYSADGDNEDKDGNEDVQSAASVQTLDFSLPSKETPVLTETIDFTTEPYVPASSFSFQLTQDTSMPKIKRDSYNERMAKDALLKAQKAMEQIDWNKIETQLKYSKRDIIKLKNELVMQIQKLNWQKINSEVKDQQGLQQLQSFQDALKQEQALKEYREYQATETYQESLNKISAEQNQLLQENAERLKQTQQETEKQLKKIQTQLKRKRVIYI